MLSSATRSRRLVRGLAAMLALGASSCVEAPSAPAGAGVPTSLNVATSFAIAGPDGASPATAAQASALDNAFNLVDRFHVVVTRQNGEVALDTTIVVTPGQPEYQLDLPVTTAAADETFTVTITALEGDTELFSSSGITVKAVPVGTGTGTTPTPTNITLSYSGPGSTATTLQLSPAYAVVSPGGTATFGASVQDQDGNAIDGVPLDWTVDLESVASVSGDGVASGGSDGVAQVTATTPAGLQGHARVYVVSGQITYVEGGALETRSAAGGDVTELPSVGGASQPSWGDGRLFYVSGGMVYESGNGEPLVGGGWPSLSPDGTKLAVDGGGTVVFANDDGSNPTPGPKGSTPVWTDDSDVLVAGGSLDIVRADGTGRTTVVSGSATLPAVGPGGIAYQAGGELRVTGVGNPLATGVVGRPAWSPDGMWLAVVTGDGLSIVPADGSAPAVPLPGLSGASDPAFQSGGGGSSPQPVSITGLDPDPPVPGEVVHILGSGFDWVIARNNEVFWPTSGGAEKLKVFSVTQGSIDVVMPVTSVAGEIQVRTYTGSGTLAFKPTSGAVQVSAQTTTGDAAAGVEVSLQDAGGTEVAHGQTDTDGKVLFTGVTPGTYTVVLTPPAGFDLQGDPQRTITVATSTVELSVEVAAQVRTLQSNPDPLEVEVGASLDVTLIPLDVNGDPISSVSSVQWIGGEPTLSATGTGLTGSITGLVPSATTGGSRLNVQIDGVLRSLPATVTSYIAGTVTKDAALTVSAASKAGAAGGTATAGAPQASTAAEGVSVKLMQGETEVATTVTDASGAYRFGSLLAGTYQVVPTVTAPLQTDPTQRTITLGGDTPTGSADFNVTDQVVQTIELDAGTATLEALDATLTIGVTARDKNNNVVDRTPAFVSMNPEIATVDASGKVTAVANGTVTIQVTVGSKTATVDITVAQKAVSLVLVDADNVPEPDQVRVLIPDAHDNHWEAKDANGYLIADRVPTFSSSDETVLTVDAAGHATVVGPGVSVLKASMDGASDQIIVNAFKVISHDVDLNNPSDLAELASGPVGEIDGSLLVQSTSLSSLSGLGLETVWIITGNATVTDNSALGDIGALGGVEEIGGDIDLTNNDALLAPPPGYPAAALKHIGGSVYVSGNATLPNLDLFSNLTDVDGAVEIADNGALTELDGLSSLAFIGGDLLLRNNPSLNSLGNFPALQHLGAGGFMIQGGGQVVGLPALQSIDGDLTVDGSGFETDPLTELQLPALTCAGSVDAYANWTLQTLGLGNLQVLGSCQPPVSPPLGAAGAAHRSRRPVANPIAARYGSVRSNVARVRAAERSALEAHWKARVRAASARREQHAPGRTTRATRVAGPAPTGGFPEAAALAAAMRSRLDAMGRPAPRPAGALRTRALSAPQPAYALAGGLTIQGNPALSTVQLGTLQHISGDLNVSGNGALTSLQLPALHDMSGGLFTSSNTGFTTLSAPALTYVDGHVDIGQEPDLQTLDLPMLQRVGDYLDVSWNDNLAELTLQALQYVGYYLHVESDGQLQKIGLPALNTVKDYFGVLGNPLLTQLQAASASALTIDGSLNVSSNDALQTIAIPGLASVGSPLEIGGNGALTGVTLASTSNLTVNGDLYIHDNTTGTSWTLSVPGLMNVTGQVWLGDNSGLSSVTMASNVTAHADGDFSVENNPGIVTLDVPKLQRVGGTLRLTDMTDPQTMDFSGLTDVVLDFYLGYNGSPGSFEPDFTGLQHVDGSFAVDSNQGLSSLSLPNLVHVGGYLDVGSNGEMTTFSAPLLDGAVGGVSISNNQLLTSFNLHALNHIDPDPATTAVRPVRARATGPLATPAGTASLYLATNAALTGFDLTSLSNVQMVVIFQNGGLTTLPALPSLGPGVTLMLSQNDALADVAGLSSVTQLTELDIGSNPSLTDLSGLAALTGLGALNISWNPQLAHVTGLTSLGNVLNGIAIQGNDNLTTVSFPALTLLGDGNGPSGSLGNLNLSGNPLLANVSFGALTEVDGTLTLSGTGLTNLSGFSHLTAPVYALVVKSNSALTDVTGLGSLTGMNILDFQSNNALTNLTLSGLTNVVSSMNIAVHDNLATVSFPALQSVGAGTGPSATTGTVALSADPLLTSASFPSLQTLDAKLYIQSTGLTDLNGFTALTSPLYGVSVTSNPSLTDILGLSNIGTTAANPAVAGFFQVAGNAVLCGENVQAVIDAIDARNPGAAFAVSPVNGQALCGAQDQ